MSNGKKKIADFLSKNLGFQSEDFYLKRYIFGYINGQKQDNPAPLRNQKSRMPRESIHFSDQYFDENVSVHP